MASSLPSASSSTAIKHRQIAHLAQQFQVLASRAEQLERLTVTTAEQAYYIRLLGGYHASWFMAVTAVMAQDPPPAAGTTSSEPNMSNNLDE